MSAVKNKVIVKYRFAYNWSGTKVSWIRFVSQILENGAENWKLLLKSWFDFFDNCPTTECIKLYKTEKGRAYLSRLLEAMVTYMYSDCPLVIAWDNDKKRVMCIYVYPKDLYRLLTKHAETIVCANHQ